MNFVKFKNDEVYSYAICGDYSNGKADKLFKKTIRKIIYQMGQPLEHSDNFIPEKYRGVKINTSREGVISVEKERGSESIKSPLESSILKAILEVYSEENSKANDMQSAISSAEKNASEKKFYDTYCRGVKDHAAQVLKVHNEATQQACNEESCCTNDCKQEKFSDDSIPKHEIKNPMGEFNLEIASNLLDAIDRFGQKVTIATFKPQQKVKPIASESCTYSAEQIGSLESFMMALNLNFEGTPFYMKGLFIQEETEKTCTPVEKKLRKFNLNTFIKNVLIEVFNGEKEPITFDITEFNTVIFSRYSTDVNSKHPYLWRVTVDLSSLDNEEVPFISNINIIDSGINGIDIFNLKYNLVDFVSFYRNFKRSCK